MNKRYDAINLQNLQLSVNLPLNGQVTITFNKGYGLRRNAYFLTNDESLQQSLEQDNRLNKSYLLAEIDNVPIAEYEAREAIKNKISVKEPVLDTPLKEFKGVDDAKKWINTTHNIPYSRLKNTTMVVVEFGLLGFELKITN